MVFLRKLKFDLDVMVIRSLIKCAEIVYFPLSIDSSNFAQWKNLGESDVIHLTLFFLRNLA